MKHLRNERGDFVVPFTACFVLAIVILLSLLTTQLSAEIMFTGIRNTVKNELTNVSIRIAENTYRAMREGNLDEYYRTLTSSTAYRNELENLVKREIAATMPLSDENYTVDNITLTFAGDGESVEYIFRCDVEYRVAFMSNHVTVRNDTVELVGRHNIKAY